MFVNLPIFKFNRSDFFPTLFSYDNVWVFPLELSYVCTMRFAYETHFIEKPLKNYHILTRLSLEYGMKILVYSSSEKVFRYFCIFVEFELNFLDF